MRELRPIRIALLVLALAPAPAAAERLDWQLDERPVGPVVGWLRDVRDGTLGLLDCVFDLQLGLFSEVALTGSAALMGVSDLVGLVDDNPWTQYVFVSVASRSPARTAYLLHVAGAEAVLGSHGLEAEWYLEAALVELNPLLGEGDREPVIPLEPLAFFAEGMFHPRVYTAHVPGSLALASATADGIVRPAGFLLRIVGLRRASLSVERFGTGLVRRALR